MALDNASDVHIQRSYPEQNTRLKAAFGLLMVYVLCEKFGKWRNQ